MPASHHNGGEAMHMSVKEPGSSGETAEAMPLFDSGKKLAGLLVPVFAMRRTGDLGIGDTQAVREAIDFCAAHHLAVLQVLPIHETVGDHSPYNPISSRALSPALLTLRPEEVPGLDESMLGEAAPESWMSQLRAGNVKYPSVVPLKLQVLQMAGQRFRAIVKSSSTLGAELTNFEEANRSWLAPYTLYRVLVGVYEGNPNWSEWRPEHHTVAGAEAWLARHPDRENLERQRAGFAYIQWVAWNQWKAVRRHADARGVFLMGEMSFGVGRCSVDVWANPDLFDTEWSMGTRPLAYFDTSKDAERWGQNWGLPPYRWENHRSGGFSWLRGRVEFERQFFHICRLDHLRGYFRSYMFPWAGGAVHSEFAKLSEHEARARTGGRLPRFVPGPDDDPTAAKMNDLQGRELIAVIREAAGGMYLFAEIMGEIPDYMHKALDDLRMPSLTFPQLERRGEDRALVPPEEMRVLSLAAYANHDHAPLAALYLHLRDQAEEKPEGDAAKDLRNLLRFAGWQGPPPEELDSDLLACLQRALMNTPCQLAVLMSSDLFGTPQRFNLPGSYGITTWSERLEFTFREFEAHPVYGARLATAERIIIESGRGG